MTGLYEEGHNTQPSSDRPNTINCAVSYSILHLYNLHQSNLGGKGRGGELTCFVEVCRCPPVPRHKVQHWDHKDLLGGPAGY